MFFFFDPKYHPFLLGKGIAISQCLKPYKVVARGDAARVCASQYPSTRQLVAGSQTSGQAARLRAAVGVEADQIRYIEHLRPSQGLVFPGGIYLPPSARTEEHIRHRNEESVARASRHQLGPNTLWTDASKAEGIGGLVTGALVRHVPHVPEEKREERVRVKRTGVLGRGERSKTKGRTYRERQRSHTAPGGTPGWTASTFSLGTGRRPSMLGSRPSLEVYSR